VTIASALSYVLGRIYVTSYYEEFGIPFLALNFTTSDFLFASVDIVFASLVAAGLVWVGYRQGVYILDSTTRLIPQLGVISAVSLAVGVLFAFVFFPSLPHLTGLTGLALGTLVGIVLVYLISLVPSSGAGARTMRLWVLIPASIATIASIPFLASFAAVTNASLPRATSHMPIAVIEPVKGKELPRIISAEDGGSKPFRVVLINGGSLYALASVDGCEEPCLERGSLRTVVIPTSDIASLCYKGENAPSHPSKPC